MLEAEVAAGVKLLDKKCPGWAKKIDRETLDMTSLEACMLGQLYDGFYRGLNALGISLEEAEKCGFCITDYTPRLGANYATLQTLWEQEIKKRCEA